jgi:hypothetical protein
MAYTVPYSFDLFFDGINLSGDHHSTATSRRERLVSLLENDFTILDSFSTGSIPRFTAVTGYADLDVMVVLHYGKHIQSKKPSEVLKAVQEALSEYRTGVRRNGQAVTLYYKSWPDVDIVPVSRVADDSGKVVSYSVPDMTHEEWIASKPDMHSDEMLQRNKSFGEQFKKIVKMIKWWNHQHSELMESYHIEVLALHSLTGSFGSYSWDVFRFFEVAATMAQNLLFHNGTTVDQYLYLNPVMRQQIVKRLETARDKAREAWYYTYPPNSDDKKAIEIWRQIFGDKFPAYG